jgi:hypothetical protein
MSQEKFLSKFGQSLSFPIKRACIDRVECSLGQWALHGNHENIKTMIARATEDILVNEDIDDRRIFKNTAPSDLTTRIAIETRGNSRSWDQRRLIFSGALIGTHPYASQQFLKLSLQLNVTRAIQAQTLIGRLQPPRPQLKLPYRLTLCPSDIQTDQENPYIANTNTLMGSDFRYAYALSKPPSAHLTDLLQALHAITSRGLEENGRWENIPLYSLFQCNLRQIEVYWEFECDHPIDAVNLLTPQLISAANKSRQYTRKLDTALSEIEQQSKSIQIEPTKDTLIRVYAKTTKRIRIEIAYKKRKIEKLIGRRTSTSHIETASHVDNIVQNASQELTELFSHIEMRRAIGQSTIGPDDLLKEINRATNDPNIACHILHGLRHHGRIIPEYNLQQLRAVQKLRQRRVMTLVRAQQSCYVLTPDYQRALEDMDLFS